MENHAWRRTYYMKSRYNTNKCLLNIKIFIINIEAWTNHTTLHYILVLLHQSATQGDQSITCTALRSRVNSLTNCSFDAVPVSLRGRHVCAIIPNCASPCDVSEFLYWDTQSVLQTVQYLFFKCLSKIKICAYCRRCSFFFFKWWHVQHPILLPDVLLRSTTCLHVNPDCA